MVIASTAEGEINKRIDAALGSPSGRSTEHAERMTRGSPSQGPVSRDYRRTADDRGHAHGCLASLGTANLLARPRLAR